MAGGASAKRSGSQVVVFIVPAPISMTTLPGRHFMTTDPSALSFSPSLNSIAIQVPVITRFGSFEHATTRNAASTRMTAVMRSMGKPGGSTLAEHALDAGL